MAKREELQKGQIDRKLALLVVNLVIMSMVVLRIAPSWCMKQERRAGRVAEAVAEVVAVAVFV